MKAVGMPGKIQMYTNGELIKRTLENNLVPSGDYIFGFADLNGLVAEKFGRFTFGISIGRRLDDEIIDGLAGGPTMEYYRYYKRVNNELTGLTKKIQEDLSAAGIGSMLIPPTVSKGEVGYAEYMETLTVDLSHKMVATRAGLGWIGKTDLLVSKAFGPRLRLTSILLDQNPGIRSAPVEKSRCGKCEICVVRCPAHAANGKLWNVGVYRDEFFDARKCREKCGELARQHLHVDERICGLCVHVCPVGKRNN
jgi:epoxyqueuosine reductase